MMTSDSSYITKRSDSNTILTLKHVSKQFKNKTVLDDIDLSLVHGDKVVLVGENGIGKSTLFRIITHEYHADEGQILLNGQIGYLPQDFSYLQSKTVREVLVMLSSNDELQQLMDTRTYVQSAQPPSTESDASSTDTATSTAESAAASSAAASPSSSDTSKDINTTAAELPSPTASSADSWLRDFNSLGGYEFSPLLAELGLADVDLDTSYSSLSGGQKTKVALIGLAVREPDLLLLDEPSNHLDIKSIKWLEGFLKNYAYAWMVISHDRTLINNSSNRIFELSPETHQLSSFRGGYLDYLGEKEKQYQRLKLEREQTEQNIKQLSTKMETTHNTQTSAITTGVLKRSSAHRVAGRTDQDKGSYNARTIGVERSNHTKTHQYRNKITSLEQQLSELPSQRHKITLEFKSINAIQQHLVVAVTDVSFAYDGKSETLSHFSMSAFKRDRIVITGKNGSGKSTLLKLIAGVITTEEGEIRIADSGTVGYLDQEQESIEGDMTPIEYCLSDPTASSSANTLAKKNAVYGELKKIGIFDEFDLNQKMKNLSIGRQRKAQLARILLKHPNILLLDEPTNHIDLLSVEEIETQLMHFPGVIIAVSHDRWFTEKIATKVVNLDELC